MVQNCEKLYNKAFPEKLSSVGLFFALISSLRRALNGFLHIGHAACWYRIFSAHSEQTARWRHGKIRVSRGSSQQIEHSVSSSSPSALIKNEYHTPPREARSFGNKLSVPFVLFHIFLVRKS